MQYKNESIFTKEQKEKIWNMATSKLIRISENKNWIVDYDKERGMYRVSYFQDNHFVDECWFDAYEEKEINEDYIKKLRKKIAYNVEDKMKYLHCCPNERDTYLHIIAPDDYPLIHKFHCNSDCYNKDCRSYHNGENNKEKIKSIKKFTEPPIRDDAWWCGYCPRCGQLLNYNHADTNRDNRGQYCWKCGQLVEFK